MKRLAPRLHFFLPVFLVLSVVAFQGCVQDDYPASDEEQSEQEPADTAPDEGLALGGFEKTEIPARATLLESGELYRLWKGSRIRLTADRGMLEDIPGAQAGVAIDDPIAALRAQRRSALVSRVLAARPQLKNAFEGIDDIDPTVDFVGRDGKVHTVTLIGRKAKRERLASAVEAFGGRENQFGIYKLLFEAATAATRSAFPDPSDTASLTFEDLRTLNGQLSAALEEAGDDVFPPAPLEPTAPTLSSTCAADEGAGTKGWDRTGAYDACVTAAPGGLYANFDWPLKNHLTCVKNQAARGTCTAFATAAALETAISVKYGRKVNLSEQDLYSVALNWWWPGFYGDGLNSDGLWRRMLRSEYVVPYESHWSYNRSNRRGSNAENDAYVKSCEDYDETCSNTVHQAGLYCAIFASNGLLYCGFMSPANEGGGFRAASEQELWDYTDASASIGYLKAAVRAKRPVVLSSEVPFSFDSPDANGFVTYKGGLEKSRGGHAYELVGYISNARIATSFPSAPQAGGQGYFIAKNSWGPCFGDAGFVYLPTWWVRTYAWSATALNDVLEE